MNWTKKFVELDKSRHDRASFDSGDKELNTFLKTPASKHMQAGISRTMLLPAFMPLANAKYPICAFYTIAPGSIRRDTLPNDLAKKLPHYPVPVFLIAQLAVHADYHGQGLGKITLIKVLEYLWEVNAHIKAYAVIVDCLNDEAMGFYLKYGFELLCKHKGRTRLFIQMKTVEELFK